MTMPTDIIKQMNEIMTQPMRDRAHRLLVFQGNEPELATAVREIVETMPGITAQQI